MCRLLLLLLLLACPQAFGSSEVAIGGAARATVNFAIEIPQVMQIRMLGIPAAVEVTAEDIARGTLTVRGTSLDVVSNSSLGYALRAEILQAAFTAVRVIGMPLGVRRPPMVGRPRPQPLPVEYELQLAPDASPGRYAWPVSLSLQDP